MIRLAFLYSFPPFFACGGPVLGLSSSSPLGARRKSGIGITRAHYQCFDAIRAIRAEALKLRAEDPHRDDQRGIAFTQSAAGTISNALFASHARREETSHHK